MPVAAVPGRHKQDYQRDSYEHGQFPLTLCVHHLCGSQAGEQPQDFALSGVCLVRV